MRVFRVFTKINGKLACWDVPADMTYEQAVKAVRDEVGLKHKPAILCLVPCKTQTCNIVPCEILT